MAEEKERLEQDQREKPMSFMTMVVITGLVGGILWSGLAYLAYVFNFTEIRPNVILEPWTIGAWKEGWLGTLISIFLIGGISIIAALIYYAALRKFQSIFVGAGYGVALFLLVFFILNPIFPGISPFWDLERNTIITSICFYILFGVFVGYSISYEAQELRGKTEDEKKARTDRDLI
ncbi:YqhR family membrane protein [Cytobacillus firmus]|uniref:YqhR n=1 Tax=Cytobacillus firmus DS1 TaxID=1307436 RepID=W7L663_CYTFI|nr:YqhR family membrane protein [Cytobacillus firmus]EWG10682.1 hypothetical protein PBF_11892 [Cytobacillus firmus DS1]